VIQVNPKRAENLLRILIAVIRNAVVHGIETAEERIEKGKDSFGRIYCKLSMNGDFVEILIGDDGLGIDADYIANKALQHGVITLEKLEEMTKTDKTGLIFESGMSQLEDADILAGRGIGLYTVREVVLSMGGQVQVHSTINVGTEFVIKVPLRSLQEN
jgi:two-component system chemotaxis sensor kinase CheA